MNEVLAALEPVVRTLEKLSIRYRVGGSVASSALGVPRSTLDVDVACEMRAEDVSSFVASLAGAYYVDAEMIRDAIARRSCFNVIHLDSMLKVDVFIRKNTAFEIESFERVVRLPLEREGTPYDITTPEDIVLHKLDWYRKGGEVSERQWSDVTGVIAVQGAALDRAYLRRWAEALGLVELLDRALAVTK
jgi:hypothetical protein